MKKYAIYVLLFITVIVLIGCKKKSGDGDTENLDTLPTAAPTKSEEVTPTLEAQNYDGEMKSYLSGLWVPKEVGLKRPWAIQFNNFKSVGNQSGIGQADIMYECIVEGGITRLLGIGENYTGDRFGSVRSSRHYFVSIADEYDAIYVHYGKTKYATSKMKELGIDHMDGTELDAIVFYRDKSIKAPNNAFTSVEGIQAGIKKKGFETEYKEGYQPHYTFYEADTDLTGGASANKLTLKFSGYTSPYFTYNPTDKLYYRFQYGKEHVDSNTGKQLTFKNIIIQFVKEWNIDKNGYQTMDIENSNGTGYYITNGKAVPITWKKKESDSWMRYYDEKGNELTINPGKTYITLFPKDRPEDVTIE
jgi:hypothetical protein